MKDTPSSVTVTVSVDDPDDKHLLSVMLNAMHFDLIVKGPALRSVAVVLNDGTTTFKSSYQFESEKRAIAFAAAVMRLISGTHVCTQIFCPAQPHELKPTED